MKKKFSIFKIKPNNKQKAKSQEKISPELRSFININKDYFYEYKAFLESHNITFTYKGLEQRYKLLSYLIDYNTKTYQGDIFDNITIFHYKGYYRFIANNEEVLIRDTDYRVSFLNSLLEGKTELFLEQYSYSHRIMKLVKEM